MLFLVQNINERFLLVFVVFYSLKGYFNPLNKVKQVLFYYSINLQCVSKRNSLFLLKKFFIQEKKYCCKI
jgi:hypothetical protein